MISTEGLSIIIPTLNEEDCIALFGQKFFDKHCSLAEEAANEQEL